jgi:hypothetical protein
MQNVVNEQCTGCGRVGHNILTCQVPDVIDFENRSHTVSTVVDVSLFRLWLTTNYGTNLNVLQGFVERNCGIEVLYPDPVFYIYEIVQYYYGENAMTDLDDLPDLIPIREIEHYSRDQIMYVLELDPLREQDLGTDCSICFEDKKSEHMVALGCNHEFCKDCTKKIIRMRPVCPCCRVEIVKVTSYSKETKEELNKTD